jgi:MFS family permease
MTGFAGLLQRNRNYRYTWMGQVVSEVGDHFNNIAVFALVMQTTSSGLAVSGVMLARALGILLAGPMAGVALDRFDRRRLMIASDLFRAVFALLFIATVGRPSPVLLFFLNFLLAFASPFFTSGRLAILPVIATKAELHTANTLTQTTQWVSTAAGAFLGGVITHLMGYEIAFVFNALSFLVSAACIAGLRVPEDSAFVAKRKDLAEDQVARPWQEYVDGLRYMRGQPLLFAIALVGVGWATGGGAAQILFTLFGETVYNRGAAGIGEIWGFAGVGLVIGGFLANRLGPRLGFEQYKWLIVACYIVHGGSYILFSASHVYVVALVFIAVSRLAVAVSSALNYTQVLRHVPDEYRGRVFSTMEMMVWGTMMLSMLAAGLASKSVSPRVIGVVSGALSSTTAIWWGWLQWSGRLPEPPLDGVDPKEIEIHGEASA